MNSPDDLSMEDMNNPAFVEWLKKRHQMPIEPDKQDYDLAANPQTTAEQAHEYRLAEARKMMRLCREWKASRN